MAPRPSPYELDPTYEDVRRQIRILVVLDILLGIAGTIAFAGRWDPMLAALIVPLLAPTVVYAIALFRLHRGARWARTFVLFVSGFGLLSFIAAASARDPFETALDLAGGLLCVYQLVILNTRRAKEYFGVGRRPEASAPGRFPKWLKVALGILGGLVLIVAIPAGLVFWLISVESRMQVWVEDVETGEARQVSREGVNDWPSFAPDGKRLAYTHVARHGANAGEVRICSLPDGRTLAALQVQRWALSPTWDRAGARIAFVTRRSADTSEVWIWSPAAGSAEKLWTTDASIHSCSWSPNGRWLVIWQSGLFGHQLWLHPTAGDARPPVMQVERATDHAIRWLPDDSGLVCVRDEHTLVIRHLDSREDQYVIMPEGFRVQSLAFFDPRDTAGIVVAGTGPGGPQLTRVSLTTGAATPWKQVRPLVERNYDLSRDGRRMAFARPGRAAR